MKTLAELKRRLVIGVRVTMTQHDWFPNSQLINVPRKIVRVQTNSIQFEGGSWVSLPKAKEVAFSATNDNEFRLKLNPETQEYMSYVIDTQL